MLTCILLAGAVRIPRKFARQEQNFIMEVLPALDDAYSIHRAYLTLGDHKLLKRLMNIGAYSGLIYGVYQLSVAFLITAGSIEPYDWAMRTYASTSSNMTHLVMYGISSLFAAAALYMAAETLCRSNGTDGID